jgi:hypothetical protein
MVGYTHVQHAQPISVAFWLTHYAAIFLRDMDRLKRAYDITDQNPLGGGIRQYFNTLIYSITFILLIHNCYFLFLSLITRRWFLI